MKNIRDVFFFSIIFLVIDQALKFLVTSKMVVNQSIVVFKDFLSIKLVYNEGAAFSILNGNRILLIGIGIIALVGILIYVKRTVNFSGMDIFIYSTLIGGVLGNLIDRILHGYVIDYISFKFHDFYFPIFNFADICIVISVILIVLGTLKEDLWK